MAFFKLAKDVARNCRQLRIKKSNGLPSFQSQRRAVLTTAKKRYCLVRPPVTTLQRSVRCFGGDAVKRRSLWSKVKPLLLGACIAGTFVTYNIHNSPPFAPPLEMYCGIKRKPSVCSKCTIDSEKEYELAEIGKCIEWFIENGEEIAAQISIFKSGKEIYSFCSYNADNKEYEGADDTTLFPIFSTTKNFTAFAMAKAVDMGWLKYEDLVVDHWPEFNDAGNKITVGDVLRHEAGLPYLKLSAGEEKIHYASTDYAQIRKLIESQTPFAAHERMYHAISRGWILNELFHRVEPNGRYMHQYYMEEIFGDLSAKDQTFLFGLNGTDRISNFDASRTVKGDLTMFPFAWAVYHMVVPIMLLGRKDNFNPKNNGQNCIYMKDKAMYPERRFLLSEPDSKLMTTMNAMMADEFAGGPNAHSKYIKSDQGMAMEQMSLSGYTNAHSVAALAAHMIYQGLSKETAKRALTGEITTKYERLLVQESNNFSIGGFNRFNFGEEEWYGWSGWGGAFFLYNLKHDVIVGYTQSGFSRPDYIFPDSKSAVILSLLNAKLNRK